LIFIRTAEDRDVEPMRLMPLLRELEDRRQMDKLSEKLVELFRQFDATYNSELFAPHFSEELYCDRPPLEALIRGLYEKNFVRYNFNALEADVLGTAYEQYLGHVVTEVQSETGLLATASHVDEKRTKRKSQGIYYTPAFVTKYIVQQTVSRWLDEHGYNPSAPPRILDMACGSGSFLIEAFDVLDRFVAKQRNQARGESDDLHDNLRRLELLQSCIFGVDKDKQAVDVARLNLMLRALHGRQKLPLLANIYNADSLRPETWQQAFPEIMHEGGFDVIIGNPPYVRQETLGKEFKIFAQQNFETYTGTADLYVYFIEQAYKELKPDGFLGMIVSNKWMRSNYGKSLRQFLASKTAILEVVDFGELPVFQDASTFPVIIIARKRVTSKQDFTFVPVKSLDFQSLADVAKSDGIRLNERALKGESWTLTTDKGLSLFEKTGQDSLALGDFVGRRIYRGVVTGCNEVFIIDQNLRDALVRKDPKSTEIIKPFVFGDEVRRYRINYQDRYLIFTRRGINIDDYPAIRDYLIPHKERLLPKPKKWQGEWLGRKEGPYQWFEIQDSTKYFPEFEKPKIVYGQFQIAPHFAYCPNTLFFGSNHYMLLGDNEETLLYLCGVLNSKLYFWYMGHIAGVLGDANERGRLISQKSHIIKFPVHVIDFANSAEKSAHDEIVKLVEEMLALQKQYQQADTALEDSRHPLKRRIESLDREIDKRVYALYKLTTAEIKIVEA
jgi:type I restriction-modification system DNA methylase subunit